MTWDEESNPGVMDAMLQHKAGFPENPTEWADITATR